MHYGRILMLVGVIGAVVGFVLKSASSAGEGALALLSQADPASWPTGFSSTWTALYNDTAWAAIVFALALIGSLIVALTPPFDQPVKRLFGLSAAVLGVLMLIVGVVAAVGASNDADALQAGFAQAAAAGAIPDAFSVSIGFGWYLLILGGVLVAIGGVVSLIGRPDEDAIA